MRYYSNEYLQHCTFLRHSKKEQLEPPLELVPIFQCCRNAGNNISKNQIIKQIKVRPLYRWDAYMTIIINLISTFSRGLFSKMIIFCTPLSQCPQAHIMRSLLQYFLGQSKTSVQYLLTFDFITTVENKSTH